MSGASGAGDGAIDLEALFAEAEVLSEASSETRAALAAEAELVHFAPGEVVGAQGEPADGLWVVADGRIEITAADAENRTGRMAAARGATIGEIGALTRDARTAWVVSRRASVLAHLPQPLVEDVLLHDAGATAAMARLVAERLVHPLRFRRLAPPEIVGLTGPASALVHERLAAAGLDGIEIVDVGAAPTERVRCDLVLHAAHDQLPVRVDDAIAEEAVVISARGGLATPLIRRGRRFRRVHRLLDDDASFARLTRRITGHERGLVLSGGGARAMAHYGVLEVLAETGFEPDLLGGTSMGAMAAVTLAMSGPHLDAGTVRRTTERAVRVMTELDLGRRATVPTSALLSTRRVWPAYKQLVTEGDLQSAWRTVYVTTANLTTASLDIKDAGPAARWAIASASAPGLWPPVADGNGDLHVDGALFDNLPVAAMQGYGTERILASNVSNRTRFGVEPGAREVRSGLHVATRNRSFPLLGKTMGRAIVASSLAAMADAEDAADAIIDPDVERVGLGEYRNCEQAVEAGRTAARRWLAEAPDWFTA